MRIFYISCLVLYCSYLHSQTFTNVAGSMGINHTYSKGFNGGGVSFCDFDYDGLEDIFFSSSLGQLIVMEKNYSNYFLNVISQYNITVIYESKTILIADYDNDGDRDIFIANFLGRNKLYRNTGSNFIDATASAGLSTDSLPSTAALWFDYNRDGLLDLYIGLYSGFGNNLNFPNHLYRNLGNGTFQYVSSSAGVSNTGNKVLAMAALDYNNDGWHDIYIASDRRIGNTMFKNNGNGTFTNVSSITNTNLEMDAMGLTIGDYDNNGYFDIYISNGEEGNAFLKNNGNGTFTDVAASLGMTVNRVCWGNNFIDYDNDADLDLYISVAQGNPDRKNKLFRNNGNGTFTLTSGIGLDNDNYESYGNAIG
ncbi:MAG: FG-GAP repeat domain-containing protein, partial [Ignavibacteria bacterium]